MKVIVSILAVLAGAGLMVAFVRRALIKGFLILALCAIAEPVYAQTPGTVRFPTNLDTSVSLFETANRSTSTLNGGIGSGDTSLVLTSGATFPSSGAITINAEIIYYTGKSMNTLTGLIRGQCGTSASAQSNGSVVRGNIISCHQQSLRDAIIATQTKIGSASSTPTANTFLVGTGTGTSAWQALTGINGLSFNIGNGTAKSGNTMTLLFSNDSNKPGIRWNGSTLTVQYSNDGTNWFDIAAGTSGIFGSGTTGNLPRFTGATSVGNSILSESAGAVTAAGSLRASSRIAAGSGSSVGFPYITANFVETFTDNSLSVKGTQHAYTLNFGSATNNNHAAVSASLTSAGSQNYNGVDYAGNFISTHAGSGTALAPVGLFSSASKTGTGNITVMGGATGNISVTNTGTVADTVSFNSTSTFSAGTTTNYYGFKAETPAVSPGALTNYYGFYAQQGDGDTTNNFAFYAADSTMASRFGWVDIGTSGNTYIKRHWSVTTTWDPASIADGAMTSTTLTITSSVGDPCIAGFSVAVPAGAILSCSVTASGTATVTLFNKTGSTLDLGSGTLRASVFVY
jgi:hypothetical protein